MLDRLLLLCMAMTVEHWDMLIDVFVINEMAHVISWSESNKLQLNLARCEELVFNRPNLKHEISLCTLPDVVRVISVKLLGVYIDHTLCFHEHVEQIAKKNCNQRFYMLQQLRDKDLVTIV